MVASENERSVSGTEQASQWSPLPLLTGERDAAARSFAFDTEMPVRHGNDRQRISEATFGGL